MIRAKNVGIAAGLAATLLMTTALTTMARAAEAAPAQLSQAARTYDLAIPAQPLPAALDAFARATGWQVGYPSALAAGRSSPGVSGNLTAEAALARLLAGTSLSYSMTGATSVTLVAQASDGATLPSVTVEARAPNPTAQIGNLLPEYAGGQVARGGQVGLLGNRDFMDTPFNQTNYTQQTIQNQQAQTLGDVMDNDPSVRSNFPGTSGVEGFNIRGFTSANTDVLFGGLYGVAPTYGSTMIMGPIERVEVLKGPNALLYGIGPGSSVGGAINLVPKRASSTPITQFTPSYSSDSQVGGHLDVGRRFGRDDSVGIRFNGVLRDGDTAIDRQSQDAQLAALGLDYQGETVRLSADFGYQAMHTEAMRRFISVVGGVPLPAAPDSSSNWSQPWTFLDNENIYGALRGEVDLVENITAFAAFGGGYSTSKTIRQNLELTDSLGTLSGNARAANGYYETTTAEFGLRSSVSTGPVRHDLRLSNSIFWSEAGSESVTAAVADNNLYNPIFSPRPTFAALPDPGDAPKNAEQENSSLALADTLSAFNDRVQLTLGVRRQQVKTDNFDTTTGAVTDSYDESKWTPVVGVVVKPLEYLSVYANYIEGLQQGQTAPAGTANEGEVFAPFATEQYEAGIKLDFGDLAATLSAFQITLPSGFIDPGTNLFTVNGEQRNRGVEFNSFGEVIEGVRLLGGATFVQSVLTKTQGGVNQGNDGPGVPSLMVNLGAEWDAPFMRGLTLTGRAIYTSSAAYDQANTRDIPSWTRFDVGARYAIQTAGVPVVVRANILNLFDQDYWATADEYGSLGLSAPRTFLLSTSFDF